ncbi:TlpA family protein disulfide reductase [Pseudomonas typographi]|uniref:TlpA family protein disulfide reductase n=1 Tax=Pseudomonas typographi TaxID=2715964 RepID=A0ABR7Z270_9PSED|nr:TlpA disulfide reductase family protein [Pseudomonas typographi]MBD1587245.1 TlpA family protein disulfide reductase [Pseudomonas typographi]MBD1599560.1 TlpA family protein disulfide reductase [Pseudomonas typographi]
MLSLSLGPFALSLAHLALLASLALALFVAYLSGRRTNDGDSQGLVWWLLLVALGGARLGFVAAYWPQYQGDWRQMLDLRDGGFLPWAGIAAALLAAAWLAWRRPEAQRGLLAATACGLVLWLGASCAIDRYGKGTPLPATALQRADGSTLTLAELRGRPMVVNLWATWCPPCRREMPVLAAAQRQQPQVRFVFINQGESVGLVANFAATAGLALDHIVFDPSGAVAREVGAMALPTTLFYSAEGQLLGTHLGELSQATLARGLKLLATPEAAAGASMP